MPVKSESLRTPYIRKGPNACPVFLTEELISKKWVTLIVRELMKKTLRFGELRKALHPISSKTLTMRLKELEDQNIVSRKLYTEVPLKVEYSLTEKGRALWPVIEEMRRWGEVWAATT